MDVMFWIWLGVIIVTAVVEFATMEIVSIWFTFGAIIPFIMAAATTVDWVGQIVVFVVISAILIVSLRSVTRKFLFKGADDSKTNLEMYIGRQYRMIIGTDFETVGAIQINGVLWRAVGLNNETIEAGAIVQVVDIMGNKFIVRELIEDEYYEGEFDFDTDVVEGQPQEVYAEPVEVAVEDKPVEVKEEVAEEVKAAPAKKAPAKKKTTTTKTTTKTAAKPAEKKASAAKATTTKPATKSAPKTAAKSTSAAKPAAKAASTKQTAKKTTKKGDNK